MGGFLNTYALADAERALADATATFKSRLADLQLLNVTHNVVGDEYPKLPVLDREATVAAAKAERETRLAEIRASCERPRVRSTNTRGLFNELPDL